MKGLRGIENLTHVKNGKTVLRGDGDDTMQSLYNVCGASRGKPKPITPIPLSKEMPAYSLPAIKKIRDELNSGLWVEFYHQPLDLYLVQRIAATFITLMKWHEEHHHNVVESLKPYMTKYKEFDDKARFEIAYRLAGGMLQLHAGEVLPLPDSAVADTWMAVEVVKSELSRKQNNRQLVEVNFRVVAGPVAGSIFTQEFIAGSISYIFKDSIKFNKYIAMEYQDLFGVNLLAYMGMTADQQLQFTRIATNSAQDKMNRNLRNGRREDCLMNYVYECAECPLGQDRCQRSCHMYTYGKGECANSRVDKHEEFLDTTRKDGYCIRCAEKLATGRDFMKEYQPE